MSFPLSIRGFVDANNISNTPLAANAHFTGSGTDVSAYPTITIACLSDTDGDLQVQFSTDNTNWDSIIPYEVKANKNEVHSVKVTRQFYRIRFINSATPQTVFRLSAIVGLQAQLISALNAVISPDADAIVVRPLDFDLMNAAGLLESYHNQDLVIGENPLINTAADEDVWGYSTTVAGAAAPTAMHPGTVTASVASLNSSSINDDNTPGGTGARTVLVVGLDSNYNIVSETVALNGTTTVTTVAQFIYIQQIKVATTGTLNRNDGTVSCWIGTSPMCQIPAPVGGVSNNVSLNAVFVVPAGHTAFLRQLDLSMHNTNANAYSSCSLMFRDFGSSIGIVIDKYLIAQSSNTLISKIYKTPIVFAEKTLFKIRANVGTNNTRINATFEITLRQN